MRQVAWDRVKTAVLLLPLALVPSTASFAQPSQPGQARPRELDARRLIGKAHFENGDFQQAELELRRCMELADDSAADCFNLSLVLTRAQKYDEAFRLLQTTRRLDPDLLAVYYLRGIIHKRKAEHDAAVENLQRVVASDPKCWGAYYNLGVCYKNLGQNDRAKTAFEAAVRIDPNHPSGYYQLITLARRSGNTEQAKQHAEVFNRVNQWVEPAQKTAEALERSEYSRMIALPRLTADTAVGSVAEVRYRDVSAAAGFQPFASPQPIGGELPLRLKRSRYDPKDATRRYVALVGGALALGDYDNDGDLDIFAASCTTADKGSPSRLYRNDSNGRFTDVTSTAGVGGQGSVMDAVFGDYDNDGHLDLYVVRCGPNVLFHNQGDGTFQDVSRQAGVDEPQCGRQAVFVDYDHDNDLDLLVVNDVDLTEPPEQDEFLLPDGFFGQVNTLMRNNGDGRFVDQTDEAGLLEDLSQSRGVVFADFDGDHDIDLFVCNADGPSLLFANARLGRFQLGGTFSPPIDGRASAIVESDFDRDGIPDLLAAVGTRLYLYRNGGKANFRGVSLPLPRGLMDRGIGRVVVFDANNDGWSDLLLLDAQGRTLHLLQGSRQGGFRVVSITAGLDKVPGQIVDLAVGDLDADGSQDILLLTRQHGLRLLRSQGAGKHWVDVTLAGERVNRCGYGAVVEVAGGGHYQRQTVRDGVVHFGLGNLDGIDVVRVTWPNGIAQNVIRPPLDHRLSIAEKVRISVSCTMLWTHNGQEFELVNEILGVGPLGVPISPGVYHLPDCTELTKIEADQLRAKDGIYRLRLTEELNEITFADQITLRVVDHPAELEIIPNEMFTAPPFPEDKFFAVAEHRPPQAATDDRKVDVLDLVRQRDGRVPTFPLTRYQGIARPHSLTLDLGDLSGAGQIMLYLDGWIYWPESSTVVAVSQNPRQDMKPLSLQVRNRQGRWQTAIESVGLPTSKGTVVPIDLSKCFLSNDYHVRLSTNLCVYFDRIFVATDDQTQRCRVTELPVAEADLRFRGFARMTRDRLGYERFSYEHPLPHGPWDPPQGMFTRYGEVTSLLSKADNIFVIFAPGDELAMQFDGRKLPELPDGWVRDYIFYANGWVKDGDLNTATSGQVGPLPFHGMSRYPYPSEESYPRAPKLDRYLRDYNTRPNRQTTGRLPVR